MEMLGSAMSSGLSGIRSLASSAPGGGLGAALLGLSGLSDMMGAISRSKQASQLESMRKQALSPDAEQAITRQVLTNLAQFGVTPDSGVAREAVARALTDAQLQRLQVASGMVQPGVGSAGSIGNTAMQLMTLQALGKSMGQPQGLATAPTTSSTLPGGDFSFGGTSPSVSMSPDLQALSELYGV